MRVKLNNNILTEIIKDFNNYELICDLEFEEHCEELFEVMFEIDCNLTTEEITNFYIYTYGFLLGNEITLPQCNFKKFKLNEDDELIIKPGMFSEYIDDSVYITQNRYCYNCIKCNNSVFCFNCKKLNDCYLCFDCNDCTESKHCYKCIGCNHCYQCHFCEFCKKCHYCYRCRNCNKVNHALRCFKCSKISICSNSCSSKENIENCMNCWDW